MNSKHGASIKTELEPETFKPNLKEASDLLEADQIEKVQTVQPCSNPALHMQVYAFLNVNQTSMDKASDVLYFSCGQQITWKDQN